MVDLIRRVRAFARRRYNHEGANGCCTCGGPRHNWVYWGACGSNEYPDPQWIDWAECDRCHDGDDEGHRLADMPGVTAERWTDEQVGAHFADFLAGR